MKSRTTAPRLWMAAMFLLTIPAFGQKKSRVVTISEVTIVGRVQKPIAAVDVSRIQPRLTLGEMRQPFLKRIEDAVRKEPF
ncbi:MAG TPA: hypothetical protein VIV60_34055 [Polyangiaceae bacterium]